MEIKEAIEKIGKQPAKELTYEEIRADLEEVVNKRADEYSKSFLEARKAQAQQLAGEYIKTNPRKDGESYEDYKKRVEDVIKDYIDQMPDEFQRNLRTYCHLGTALFSQMGAILAEFRDFKEVYLAIHEDDILKYAEKHKEEIQAQQKAMAQQQINQERHERAVANKQKLDKKLGK